MAAIFERIGTVKISCEEDAEEKSLAVGISGELSTSDICLLFLHGAGSCRATWHDQVEALSPYFLILAPDMRSHGESSFCSDLSLHSLVEDISKVIKDLSDIIETRRIVVIGHSVGGSIAANIAANESSVAGVIVIDLVEETALESLQHMRAVLDSWPSSFNEVSDCIKWSTKMRRPQSMRCAEISIPPLLKFNPTTSRYEWTTALGLFEEHWESWFEGFDSSFLDLTIPHCLLLASAERLDSKMCAAHMQGLYELHVVQGGMGGHFIQEDNSEETLGIIVNFLKRRQLIEQQVANTILLAGLSTNAMPSSYRSPFPPMYK